MKFGRYLELQARPEWRAYYVDYKGLKKLIAASVREDSARHASSPHYASLSVARDPRIAAEDEFHLRLNDEVEKVGDFVQRVVVQLRAAIKSLGARLSKGADPAAILRQVRQVDGELLALEKYAVLNYMVCHKILKKHDRLRPGQASQHFFLHHLHRKPWVNGYFRDLMPPLSALYTRLKARPDSSPPPPLTVPPSSRGYVYHLRSFWVTAEDLPVVRHHIMQNLPICTPPGEPPQLDEEFHTLYLDNSLMELYHGRLFDKPESKMVRVMWRGDRAPEWVDLEWRTFQEGWKREPPAGEALPLKYSQLPAFLNGSYGTVEALDDLEEAGKGVADAAQCAAYQNLHTALQSMVNSKQLLPVVRTCAMRTAFQAPHDALLRVTLDADLVAQQEDELGGQVVEQLSFSWDDGSMDSLAPGSMPPTPPHHVLPYALLQVHMYRRDGEQEPRWLTELWEAGYLSEIHEFSIYLHACAELYPDILRALPYWVDDPGLKAARARRAARAASFRPPSPHPATLGRTASEPLADPFGRRGLRKDPHSLGASSFPRSGSTGALGSSSLQRSGSTGALGASSLHRSGSTGALLGGGGGGPAAWLLRVVSGLHRRSPSQGAASGTPPLKGAGLKPRRPLQIANYEPAAFLQNERVFNSWLRMSVQTASIAVAMLGLSACAYRDPLWASRPIQVVHLISLILLPISVLMCAYAVGIFAWRRRCIRLNQWERFHDELGPLVLAGVVAVAMMAIMAISIMDWWVTHRAKHHTNATLRLETNAGRHFGTSAPAF